MTHNERYKEAIRLVAILSIRLSPSEPRFIKPLAPDDPLSDRVIKLLDAEHKVA